MMRHLGWARVALLLGGIGLAAAEAPADQASVKPAAPPQRPNLVIFLADDLGLLDTPPYGDTTVKTPNLDRLAKAGVTFDRAFVASPACAPSRAAMLTGLMPAKNGAEPNQAAPHSWVKKLPAYLHELGYEVVAFGKVAHYKQAKLYGFDHWEHDTFHDPEGIPAAVNWLRNRHDNRPLAFFVGSNWPHVPWPDTPEGQNPQKLSLPDQSVDTPITRDARARYQAAIARLDAQLGQVLDATDQVLGKNTFVLFSSDHGAQWPFGKWNLYDTGIRTPLIVRWGGHIQPGTHSQAMVSWIDFLPTFVDLGGGTPPADIDGRSFAPVLRGQTTTARTEIFTTHNNDGAVNVFPMRSVRTDRYHYILNVHPEWVYTTHIDQWVNRVDSGTYFPSWRRAAATDPKAKQIVQHYYHRPAEELYDVEADPQEHHNLAADPRMAGVMTDLRARLAAWRTEQGDTIRIKEPPHLAEGPIDGVPVPLKKAAQVNAAKIKAAEENDDD